MDKELVTKEFCSERQRNISAQMGITSSAQASQGASILAGMCKITSHLEAIDNRLYHDNGATSIQSAVNAHDQELEAIRIEFAETRHTINRFGWWFFCGVVSSAGLVLMTRFMAG